MTQHPKSPATEARAETTPQDLSVWLKKPITLTGPTWVFLVAGLVALATMGLALD